MAGGPANLNSSYANASIALSSKVASQAYNLRAEANSERQATVSQNNQIDPSVLARIAIEEELKKKGGGGGGTKYYNPTNWIPYSFSLLAKAIDQARLAVANAFLQAINTFGNNVQSGINQVATSIAEVFQPVTNLFQNVFVNFAQNAAKNLNQFSKNPIEFSIRMATNVAQTGLAIFAAVVNGLKKAIYGKDEAVNEAQEEIYKEDGLLSQLMSFFNPQDENRESNGKNIKAHLNNKAKMVTQRQNKKEYLSKNA